MGFERGAKLNISNSFISASGTCQILCLSSETTYSPKYSLYDLNKLTVHAYGVLGFWGFGVLVVVY